MIAEASGETLVIVALIGGTLTLIGVVVTSILSFLGQKESRQARKATDTGNGHTLAESVDAMALQVDDIRDRQLRIEKHVNEDMDPKLTLIAMWATEFLRAEVSDVETLLKP